MAESTYKGIHSCLGWIFYLMLTLTWALLTQKTFPSPFNMSAAFLAVSCISFSVFQHCAPPPYIPYSHPQDGCFQNQFWMCSAEYSHITLELIITTGCSGGAFLLPLTHHLFVSEKKKNAQMIIVNELWKCWKIEALNNCSTVQSSSIHKIGGNVRAANHGAVLVKFPCNNLSVFSYYLKLPTVCT